jgi:orotidine-5'-phosphate decarboxylase
MTSSELYQNILRKGSFLCIGLDSDPDQFPECIKVQKNSIFEFNKAIIDATAQYVVAYKPNLAFYEAQGADGWRQLEKTVNYIRKKDPSIFIIADATMANITNIVADVVTINFLSIDFIFFFFKIFEFFTCDF